MYEIISVLLAVYNPNLVWLEELLRSVNQQSFQNYELIIMDDCSEIQIFHKIKQIAASTIDPKKDVYVYRSSKNEGTNQTFQKLIQYARGGYIAFCDQDDIWEKEKLEILATAIKKQHSVMAYSDMSVIDQNGRIVYTSLKKMRKRLQFLQGEHVTAGYMAQNCTAGCSMLIRKDVLKRIPPFHEQICYDHWTAAFASAYGRISFIAKPLMRYRRHANNQTGFMNKITGKQDYYQLRVLPMCILLNAIKKQGIHFKQEREVTAFAMARKNKQALRIWKYRKFCKKYAYFDLLLIYLPDQWAVRLFRLLRERQQKAWDHL